MSYSIDPLTADCYTIDPDELMVATIQAAGGVEDPLKDVFSEAIRHDEGSALA